MSAGMLGNTLMGGYLPQTDPYVQAILGQLGTREQQDVSALRNMYGGAGLGMSEGLQKAEAQLRGEYGGQEGNLLLNQYNQERARQMGAAQLGSELGRYPIEQAWRGLMGAYQPMGQTTMTTPSLFSQLLEGAGAAAEMGWRPFS
jgi:hypothetical protein